MKKLIIITMFLMSTVRVNAQVDTLFTTQPTISVDEVKIMKKEILIYLQNNPDSNRVGIYQKLDSLSRFILNPKLGQNMIPDIPLVIANQIERTYFNGNILKWKPNDEQQMIDSQQQMNDIMNKRNIEARALLAVKVFYRRKYLILTGQSPN